MKLEQASESATSWQSRAMLVFMPIAAIAIISACVWKLKQVPVERSASSGPRILQASPMFELLDQNSETVRLDRYIGRHDILLVFFDRASGAAGDPWLKVLNGSYEAIEASGTIVLGVSTALPQQNRPAQYGIPLLSEVNPAMPVHKQWGLVKDDGAMDSGVFYIDRKGEVEWAGKHPKPIDDPALIVRAILQGRDPESVL